MGACASFAINYRDPQSVRNLRRHLEHYLPIRHLFTQDFYPLTPWTEDTNAWLAFQFHDPVKQVGVVQAFRNPASNSQAVALKLRALDARQTYLLSVWSDADGPAQTQLLDTERSGEELMTVGVELQNAGQDGAVVLEYRPKGS
jgi:hypothetical protein